MKIEFCGLVAAGIVSTNLYLKNLRFCLTGKPGNRVYQLRHRLEGLVSEVSFNEQELLCHIT